MGLNFVLWHLFWQVSNCSWIWWHFCCRRCPNINMSICLVVLRSHLAEGTTCWDFFFNWITSLCGSCLFSNVRAMSIPMESNRPGCKWETNDCFKYCDKISVFHFLYAKIRCEDFWNSGHFGIFPINCYFWRGFFGGFCCGFLFGWFVCLGDFFCLVVFGFSFFVSFALSVNGSQTLHFLWSTYCRQHHAIISTYITECGSICPK